MYSNFHFIITNINNTIWYIILITPTFLICTTHSAHCPSPPRPYSVNVAHRDSKTLNSTTAEEEEEEKQDLNAIRFATFGARANLICQTI